MQILHKGTSNAAASSQQNAPGELSDKEIARRKLQQRIDELLQHEQTLDMVEMISALRIAKDAL